MTGDSGGAAGVWFLIGAQHAAPCGGKSAEQVGFEEDDAIGEAKRVALRCARRERRENIERVEFCRRELFGESDRDAAGPVPMSAISNPSPDIFARVWSGDRRSGERSSAAFR